MGALAMATVVVNVVEECQWTVGCSMAWAWALTPVVALHLQKLNLAALAGRRSAANVVDGVD
eukprot:7650033-Pyramimonas_sp.AAC.1